RHAGQRPAAALYRSRPRASRDLMNGDPLVLSIRELKVHFPGPTGPVRAVDGVDLDLRAGETLALVGESGCGKSTLARALVGLVPATAGRVTFLGAAVSGLSRRALRPFRQKIQLVFQDPYASLNPRFTILETLSEPLLLHGHATRSDVDAKVSAL